MTLARCWEAAGGFPHTDDADRLRQIRPRVLPAHRQMVHRLPSTDSGECFREIDENEIFWLTTRGVGPGGRCGDPLFVRLESHLRLELC